MPFPIEFSTGKERVLHQQALPEAQHVPLLLTMPVLQQISVELLPAAVLFDAVAVVLHRPVEMAQLGPVYPDWHWQAEVVVLQTPLSEQSAVELQVKVLHRREAEGVYPSWLVQT